MCVQKYMTHQNASPADAHEADFTSYLPPGPFATLLHITSPYHHPPRIPASSSVLTGTPGPSNQQHRPRPSPSPSPPSHRRSRTSSTPFHACPPEELTYLLPTTKHTRKSLAFCIFPLTSFPEACALNTFPPSLSSSLPLTNSMLRMYVCTYISSLRTAIRVSRPPRSKIQKVLAIGIRATFSTISSYRPLGEGGEFEQWRMHIRDREQGLREQVEIYDWDKHVPAGSRCLGYLRSLHRQSDLFHSSSSLTGPPPGERAVPVSRDSPPWFHVQPTNLRDRLTDSGKMERVNAKRSIMLCPTRRAPAAPRSSPR